MEWSREYLERHNIHRVLEDCVEDLVVDQPPTTEAIVKTMVQRLESIHRRFDNPPVRVVLVFSDPHSNDFRKAVDAAAAACGASVFDARGLKSEEIRDLLANSAEKAFVLNFPTCLSDAIAFEGCYGKPHKAVLFESPKYLTSVPRSDPQFMAYARGVNAVAELFKAKKQLVRVHTTDAETASAALISAFT